MFLSRFLFFSKQKVNFKGKGEGCYCLLTNMQADNTTIPIEDLGYCLLLYTESERHILYVISGSETWVDGDEHLTTDEERGEKLGCEHYSISINDSMLAALEKSRCEYTKIIDCLQVSAICIN